jgi:hypothetical protein
MSVTAIKKRSAASRRRYGQRSTRRTKPTRNRRLENASRLLDLRRVIENIGLLLHGTERHVTEDLRYGFADLPRSEVGRFFLNFAELADLSVIGTDKRIVGLKFSIPGSGVELLSALRAYKSRRQDMLAHGSLSQAEPNAYKHEDSLSASALDCARAARVGDCESPALTFSPDFADS